MRFSLTAALLLATAFTATTASPYGPEADAEEYGPSRYWRDGARVHLRRRDNTYLRRCYGCLDHKDTCAVQGGTRPWAGGDNDDDAPTVWIIRIKGERGAFCDERDGQCMHRSHERRGRHYPLCFEHGVDEDRGYWEPHWGHDGYASFRSNDCRLGYCERRDCPWGGNYGVFGGLDNGYFSEHGRCGDFRIEDAGYGSGREGGYRSGREAGYRSGREASGYRRVHEGHTSDY